ncbi:Yip1 domain protein [Sporotomaculum syntrophicum]|uniref:Yip1 domain protein n=1 Tax=Sporotomaculum syntrophicum TaxID=182264 RepID=A0A9D3AZK5_9FIRM|nr:Yip1 family protein [Sporotomaculum syntrophicum]KAF1085994.1 Yip1 domain protein [Sporotomaculum syntrophicum]
MDSKQTDKTDAQIPVDGLPKALVTSDALDEEGANVYLTEQKDNINHDGQDKSGILDIIYGILFEPGRTFTRFAQKPPIVSIVIIFLALNLAETLTSLYTTPVYIDRINSWPGIAGTSVNQAMISFMVVVGFLFSVIKWFFMAGLLHLLAELYGGNGTAKSVWVVYGAAGFPAVFMIPLQIGTSLLNAGGLYNFIAGLLTLGLYVWCVILLIIGLREVHQITTGRAALIVIMPWLILLLLLLITLIFIGTTLSSFVMQGF